MARGYRPLPGALLTPVLASGLAAPRAVVERARMMVPAVKRIMTAMVQLKGWFYVMEYLTDKTEADGRKMERELMSEELTGKKGKQTWSLICERFFSPSLEVIW